jgi:hypothetical protein
MFALADIVDLLAHKFARLRRGGFTFKAIALRTR